MSQESFNFNGGRYKPSGVSEDFLPFIAEGAHCPTCAQYAKIYDKRNLTGAMAYALILIARYRLREGNDFCHVEKYLKSLPGIPASIRGDVSKLRHWGLIESKKELRDDGSPRNGFYRITDKGLAFVRGEALVQKYLVLYNDELLGMRGDWIAIEDALGKNFNYSELMGRWL